MTESTSRSAREVRLPWFVPALAILWIALRFVLLEHSPPGFYGDEIRGALNAICLGETGESAYGERWPLFVPGGGAGLYSPPFLYFSAGWAQLFGYSIASFRAIAAFFSVLTIAALYGWLRRTAGAEIAGWAALVAALSPWSFQFARIAWDPPLAPGFLMLALWAWSGARALPAGLAAGALAALAMYAYPPMRVQAPLVFAALFAIERAARQLRVRAVLGFALSAGVVSIPLLIHTVTGELNQRGLAEAVFNPEYVNANRGADSPFFFVVKTTLANFAAHFAPGYLFFTGDANGRHSTQRIGELGFVEVLGVGIGVMLLVERWLGAAAAPAPASAATGSWGARRLLGFCGFALLAGILPAALCHTGVPHALRSSGAWPFQAALFGFLLSRFARGGARAVAVIGAVAILHTAWFAHAWFVAYARIDDRWFHGAVRRVLSSDQLESPQARRLTRVAPEGYRYFRILAEGLDCRSSQASLTRYLESGVTGSGAQPPGR